MPSNIGVSIVERESSDAGRIVPSDIFTIGCVSTSLRGPVDVAVALYNITEDKRVYGEFGRAYLGGYVRRGLFNNCREYGARVYNVRVLGSDAVSATLVVNDAASTPAPCWAITSGYLGHASPGLDGNNVKVEVKASKGDTANRDLYVYYKGPKDSAAVLKEVHTELNLLNVVSIVNAKSVYVMVALSSGATLVPAVKASTSLATGADGAAVSQTEYTAAFSKLNGLEIPMIFNADLHSFASAGATQTYVEGRGSSMGIIASAYGASIATLTTDYTAYIKAKSFMVGYRGWVNVEDEYGGTIMVPAIGHAIGAGWIRKAVERGGYPWIAPAGPSTSLRDVINLEVAGYTPGEVDTLVQTVGFNPIMFVPGSGFIIRTSRTFSSVRKNYSAHVRRTTNFFISTFKNAFMWIEQESNSEDTRRRVRDGLKFFSQDCYRNGAFGTRGGFDNNVKIKCDEENNSPDMQDRGELACDFAFHPVEAVESATINIFQTRDNLNVSDN